MKNSSEQWLRAPLKLNQRFWKETNLYPPRGDLLGVPYLDPESGLSNLPGIHLQQRAKLNQNAYYSGRKTDHNRELNTRLPEEFRSWPYVASRAVTG